MLHKLNYFDERLSGFGEEDGDMHYKFIRHHGYSIPSIPVHGVHNTYAYHLRNQKIETHQDNKPKFNREMLKFMYRESESGITTPMCPIKIERIIDDVPQYPYEMFVNKNKHNIQKFDKVVF